MLQISDQINKIANIKKKNQNIHKNMKIMQGETEEPGRRRLNAKFDVDK